MAALGAAAAGVAAGAHVLFGYNRENYKYDREMRLQNEYQILEWRSKQSELWRDDVREIIGLTEKKMDNYLIISTLSLGMCVGMFTEGRLVPGTPPWLLHFYMLTLGASFMYLLMAVWFAMHASIVASCNSVRILTQFVRLPVPTWDELEKMRTYAASFEEVGARNMLRVPFLSGAPAADSALRQKAEPGSASDEPSAAEAGAARGQTFDPWRLELNRAISELQPTPIELRRHVDIARRASKQYQCFDAFARVAMTFGTNQLLHALTYYCLGYCGIQDGAPQGALSVATIMVAISMVMMHMDLSLTKKERSLAQALTLSGPLCVSCAVWSWSMQFEEEYILMFLPVAYISHALWLAWGLKVCGVTKQPGGAMLPLKFRAVLYIDVFGWLQKEKVEPELELPAAATGPGGYTPLTEQSSKAYASSSASSAPVQAEAARPRNAKCLSEMPTVDSLAPMSEAAATPLAPTALGALPASLAETLICTDVQVDRSGELLVDEDVVPMAAADLKGAKWQWNADKPTKSVVPGPNGALPQAPPEAFKPMSFLPGPSRDMLPEEDCPDTEITTGHDRAHPGQLPWTIFRSGTVLLILLWSVGIAVPLGAIRGPMMRPLLLAETEGRPEHREHRAKRAHATVVPHITAKEEAWLAERSKMPALTEGHLVHVNWPSHSGFMPRALSADPFGRQLVVADDFGIYAGKIERRQAATGFSGDSASIIADFERLPQCAALDGHALKDVKVACPSQDADSSACRVLVLHSHGQRLAECPLPRAGHHATDASATKAHATWARDVDAHGAPSMWSISSDWLHAGSRKTRRESVESVAINSHCLSKSTDAANGSFRPGKAGCVVVGTTSGRVVRLRGRSTDRSRLVPVRAVQLRSKAVSQGSLHVFPNGFGMALRAETGSVQAFDSSSGKALGEWSLPDSITWVTLTCGGDNLFVLGQPRNATGVQLYRFPVPESLQAWHISRERFLQKKVSPCFVEVPQGQGWMGRSGPEALRAQTSRKVALGACFPAQALQPLS
eukprot:CAMPEP_0195066016 /NCGR_PEP_ID=MMETSP0448-20130528/11486_1 /TAXON_ID=66468 /ORGANISM="Heterocapsa triquestra, Strain CCMP 448" /LENGTH=1017 /DNA_ID=CAMNT_0040097187 /DNA_START=78 /DNA_END=3132 /DNA_ORIENTATION=-